MQSADEPARPESVGFALRAARLDAGLSVEDVSSRTRIRASLIEKIEIDDFVGCGGAVYARGHIRSIANMVGLDPGPLLAAYDAEHERVPTPVVLPSPEFDPLNRRDGSARRGGFRWAPAMIVSLVAVCALALVALLLPGSDDGEPTGGEARGGPASATPGPAAPGEEDPAATEPAPVPTTPPPSGVNVRVEARDAQSWLEVRDEAERLLLQQLLQQGDSREISSAGALEVRMGNAGAVDLSCNGESLGVPGGPGEVVTVRLVASDNGTCAVGGDGAPAGAA